MRIRIKLLFRVIGICCNHWSIDPQGLYFKSRASIVSVSGSILRLKLLNYDINEDPNPGFHSNADPDPDTASKNNADPCGFGYAALKGSLLYICAPEEDRFLALWLADVHMVVGNGDELAHPRVAGLQRHEVQVQAQVAGRLRLPETDHLRPKGMK